MSITKGVPNDYTFPELLHDAQDVLYGRQLQIHELQNAGLDVERLTVYRDAVRAGFYNEN